MIGLTKRIEVEPSEIQPGRWNFYVHGERRGSAGTKKLAIKMAEEILESIESYRRSVTPEQRETEGNTR